jgi:triosephosphate isomerase
MAVPYDRAVDLARALVRRVPVSHGNLIVCPSFPALEKIGEILQNTGICLGAQDTSDAQHGAFTGDVSAGDLRTLGCTHVILGHSERRRYHGETDEIVHRKLMTVLKHNLTPILCVGDTLEDRRRKMHETVVVKQLHDALRGIPPPRRGVRFYVAYEPVWAIGTGHSDSPQEASNMSSVIFHVLAEHFRPHVLQTSLRILYGGSVRPENAAAYVQNGSITGLLVGGTSQHALTLFSLLRILSSS